jgi:hypothetical protein
MTTVTKVNFEQNVLFEKVDLSRLKSTSIVAVIGNAELAVQTLHRFAVCNHQENKASNIGITHTKYVVEAFGGDLVTWGEIKESLAKYIQTLRPDTTYKNAMIEAGHATSILRRCGVVIPLGTKK